MVNKVFKKAQMRTLLMVIGAGILILGLSALLISHDKKEILITTPKAEIEDALDVSFSEANLESALNLQQKNIESIKIDIEKLQKLILKKEHEKYKPQVIAPIIKPVPVLLKNINVQAFTYRKPKNLSDLNPEQYVPSGTFVTAVVLGGADADASVNGQSKNNGVMLFKLLSEGTLPNGAHSNLKGCFVTGSSYGDISSERAFVILDKLSCAQKGKPIIDKAVTGWAFFGGKVGIKGKPLMRDNKIMQWAGISGAMSGIASAAQYSQSIQTRDANIVPPTNVAPYASYGGLSKASEVLSYYYVKRAEQYHPVIQVGAGSIVTIVFKDGFYLKEIDKQKPRVVEENSDFQVPEAVLNRIDKSYGAEQ